MGWQKYLLFISTLIGHWSSDSGISTPPVQDNTNDDTEEQGDAGKDDDDSLSGLSDVSGQVNTCFWLVDDW